MTAAQPADTETVRGFVVHSLVQRAGRDASRIACLGRLDDGRTFAAVWSPYRPRLFVRSSDADAAVRAVPGACEVERSDRRTIDGEPVVAVSAASVADLRDARSACERTGIRTYEADVAPTDSFLIDHRIHGTVELSGPIVDGKAVDCVMMNPTVSPVDAAIALEVVSIDIETDVDTGEILAIALVSTGAWKPPVSTVLLVNPRGHAIDGDAIDGHAIDDAAADGSIEAFADEAALLRRFIERVRTIDPDIITGWNVIDFDLATIAARLDRHAIEFAISRSTEPARFLPASRDRDGRRQNAGFACQGRQAIDGLRLVRYGPEHFSDRRLDSVANAVLGTGKTIAASTSASKIATLRSLYRDDPVAFCRYCLNDADLVLQILNRTGLLDLTIRRGSLTGVGLARAWTSVQTFEFLYIEQMHARSLVAPTLGVDRLPLGEAPGGAILRPRPGLWRNVMVFDFKSLYPSLIRTFGIDPVAFLGMDEPYADQDPPASDGSAIVAPNGARFARDGAILPQLLDRFWAEREAARLRDDQVARYVYKIVMNSFYGVLGTPGCRFAGTALAGAITGFGQYFLHWTRAAFVRSGMRVIYGDTDSLFVVGGSGDTDAESTSSTAAELYDRGQAVCAALNQEIAGFIESAFRVDSKLELEFEIVYDRFYLPTVRHAVGTEARGRAKGYAGRPIGRDGQPAAIDVKGMEAIRSDWTPVAQEFQRELLTLLFADASPDEIHGCVARCVGGVRDGTLDDRLVYSRRLRKGVGAYTKSKPPHVQAAELLPPEDRDGDIAYVITTAGPQPIAAMTAAIDHEHYVDRQIRPIAEPICEVAGVDPSALFEPTDQLSLF